MTVCLKFFYVNKRTAGACLVCFDLVTNDLGGYSVLQAESNEGLAEPLPMPGS